MFGRHRGTLFFRDSRRSFCDLAAFVSSAMVPFKFVISATSLGAASDQSWLVRPEHSRPVSRRTFRPSEGLCLRPAFACLLLWYPYCTAHFQAVEAPAPKRRTVEITSGHERENLS
jgi:hypothetical protein